jgi:tagatose 6-phosphate kinase
VGRFIARGLREEGITHACTRIEGESRTCLILDDVQHNTQTVLNEPGPEVSATEFARFADRYRRLLRRVDAVVISGSLPPGLAADAYAEMASDARSAGRRVLLDTSGEPLREALAARPYLVKLNQTEAADLLGCAPADAPDGLDSLRALGAGNAMITLGSGGAVLLFEGETCRFVPPPIAARNAVGSGDAVMAGLAAGLRRELAPVELGRLAVAAGAANALHGMGRCELCEIEALQGRVVAERPGAAPPAAEPRRFGDRNVQ